MKIVINPAYHKEKTYIIDVLLGEFLRLDYNIELDKNVENYNLHFDNKTLIIKESALWKASTSNNADYLHEANIPIEIVYGENQFTPEKDIPILYGNADLSTFENQIDCGLDIFASAFFMLSRWEEYVNPARDAHNRFPAKESLAYKFGFHRRPVVNEYLEMLWNMLSHLSYTGKRKESSYSFTLTHDVDSPLLWDKFSMKDFLKDFIKLIFKSRRLDRFNLMITRIKTKMNYKSDPFFTFDFIMDLSEKVGIKSHFFFMVGGKTKYDNRYQIDEPYIQNLIKSMEQRGHRIGLHPSYDAYNSPEIFNNEVTLLRNATNRAIETGREHYLRFEVPATWHLWNENGMKWDSTIGYAEEVGFRAGTCFSYPVFDILERKKLQLVEKPMVAMEVSLYNYMQLDFNDIMKIMSLLNERVRKYNGDFVFLWHNSHFFDGVSTKERMQHYIEIIKLCA
jgi:peptidoglycan/xylan/chitin deacetylase (PgdA/CDA1 family)